MSSSHSSSSTIKVLFVDDEREILNALKRQISLVDEFDGIFLTNPLEVLDTIDEEDIQIIVADVVMPQQDGISLLQEVKVRYPEVTRILLTAYGDYNTSIRAINEAEVFGFITKPWEQDYLFGHLRMARQMILEDLNVKVGGLIPFVVVAEWEDEQEIVKLASSIDNQDIAQQFSKRVFLTSSALFGPRYRFQNNLFTLPFKESRTVVRGLLDKKHDKNYGIFIFTNDFDSDRRRELDSIISTIEQQLGEEIGKQELQELMESL